MSETFKGVVKLEPGDRLLIVTPEVVTMARAEEIKDEVRRILEGDDPIRVLGGRGLGVIIIPADYSTYSIAEKKEDTWSHYCDKTNSIVILPSSNLSCLACQAYPGDKR